MLAKRKTALEAGREFMAKYITEKSRRMSEERREHENKRKVGRPLVPDEEKRGKNVLKTYVNDTELEIIKGFVGARSTSDVIRQLLLDAAEFMKHAETSQ